MNIKQKNIIFPKISSLGDKALIVEFGDHFDVNLNKKALALDFTKVSGKKYYSY